MVCLIKIPKKRRRVEEYIQQHLSHAYIMLGDLELRETKSSKGAGLGVRLYVTSRGQAGMEVLGYPGLGRQTSY